MFLELTFKQTALGGGLSVATVGHLCKHSYRLFSLNQCIVECIFCCCDCDVVILWHMDFRMIVVVRYELERNYFRLMSVFNRLESWNLILQDSKMTLSL